MTLNLKPIVKVAESFMIDSVTITRLEDGDRTFNNATGVYTEHPRTIYSGKAFVSPMGSPAEIMYRAEEVHRNYYEVGIPVSAPEIKVNDRLIVNKSIYDDLLVGQNLCVEGIIPGTFTVHRRIQCYLDQSGS